MILYTLKLLVETLKAWGFRKWLSFWSSHQAEIPLEMNGFHFLIRGSSIKTKMTDTFAVMESIHHNLYNRRFFHSSFDIKETDTVIDIGGYVGSFTIPAARRARKGIVYSFEPIPEHFRQLVKHCALNDLKNVEAFNCGISSTNDQICLGLDNFNPASSSMYLKTRHQLVSPAQSLSSFFKQQKIEKCNFLKIDCEGAEYEILMESPPELLKKIEKIACEYHQPHYYGVTNKKYTPSHLSAFLRRNNFHVVQISVNPYLGMIYAVRNSHDQ
jgi:FkbM family methyltransferase